MTLLWAILTAFTTRQWCILLTQKMSSSPHTSFAAISPLLQHCRLGHISHRRIKKAKQLTDLARTDGHVEHCEACRLGKAKKIVSRDPMPKASRIGQIVYVDVQHIKPTAHDGTNYATFILDDYSRMPFARFHMNRGEALDQLIAWCKEFHNATGFYPMFVCKDLECEFNKFNKFAADVGIIVRHSPPRTPDPNGVIE